VVFTVVVVFFVVVDFVEVVLVDFVVVVVVDLVVVVVVVIFLFSNKLPTLRLKSNFALRLNFKDPYGMEVVVVVVVVE